MKKTKTFENIKPLAYGFILSNENPNPTSLKEICGKTKSSITIVDTGNYVLDWFLKECGDYLNNSEIVVAGLLSKETLGRLKGKGVRTGFFRCSNVSLSLGLVIIDKKKAWACFGEGRAFLLADGHEEIFKYVNHLLWTKTDMEYSFGETREVKEARLSVLYPEVPETRKASGESHACATSNLVHERLIVNEFKDCKEDTCVWDVSCHAFSDLVQGKPSNLSVEIIPDCYYHLLDADALLKGVSFSNKAPEDLLGKNVWHQGKTVQVKQAETIEEEVFVPLDELDSFEPDFEKAYAHKKGITIETKVEINVLPLKQDGTYSQASNYKTHDKIQNQIEQSLASLVKLASDDKKIQKQIEAVKSETNFAEKVTMYNELVANASLGIEVLKNKKGSLTLINESREKFAIPHEEMGTLLVKGKETYLAIPEDGDIKSAKAWLKENEIKATLIAR